jgi:hypothetical protein
MQNEWMEAGTSRARSLWWWTLGTLAALLAWDAAGLDLPLAWMMGGQDSFALREHWAPAVVFPDGACRLAWLAGLWWLAGVWCPTGVPAWTVDRAAGPSRPSLERACLS